MVTKVQGQDVSPNDAKRVLCAVLLFLKIVWRKWDKVEIEEGKWVTLRIGWSTA